MIREVLAQYAFDHEQCLSRVFRQVIKVYIVKVHGAEHQGKCFDVEVDITQRPFSGMARTCTNIGISISRREQRHLRLVSGEHHICERMRP